MQPIQGQDEEQAIMNMEYFIEEVYEIAFGDNAINRDFNYEEVLEVLREYSKRSLIYDELST